MTNKQNDEALNIEENINNRHYDGDECIKSDGNRVPVQKDSKTVADESEDYIFLKKRRVKKRKSSSNSAPYDSKDTFFVKSDKTDNKYSQSYRYRHRHKRRRKKKMKLWKKILLSVGCVILSIILIAVGLYSYMYIKGGNELLENTYTITAPEGVDTQDDGEFVVYKGKTYKYNANITSILLMGVDKRELEETEIQGTGGQADVIVLLAVDTKTGKINMVNISRDTMTEVTVYSANGGYIGTEEQQICLSYAYGDGKRTSCENTVNSVKRLFYNIPIKSYLALELDGIVAVNDSIGGVDVVSPETIGSFVEGESYHLEGSMAEEFVRERTHDVANANTLRMKRQQIYVTEFLNKAISATKKDITVPVELFNSSSPYTCTNLNPSKILYLAQSAVTSEGMSVEMSNVPGESKMGEQYAEFYVDEEKFYEQFLNVFYTEVK